VPKTSLTDGRRGRARCLNGTRWQPLARHLVLRFAPTGGNDVEMIRIAVAVFADAAQGLDSRRPEFPVLVVPLVVRALRRHRHDRIRSRPESVQQYPALLRAMVAAEGELSRRLRRSPTVAELAVRLELAEHQIVAMLEAEWAAGSGVPAVRRAS
jgi:RNA polymerase sigma-B factor